MSTTPILKTPITVGIVGLGRAGWGLHLKPVKNIADFQIVAVADPLPERSKEAAELTGCSTFTTLDELLAGSDAQLVIIATPSVSHYEDVCKVLNAGRHCIVEKPLALTTEEANALVALAQEKGLKLFIHHIHLHGAQFYHLKGIIDSGKLGKIFSIRTSWANYARRWDWQALKKNGGGQLNNTCSHVLSVVLPLLGAPAEVAFADLRNIKDVGDAEDHTHVVLRTATGVTADVLVTSAMALSGPRWILCGTLGTLVSDGKTSKVKYYDGTKVESLSVLDEAAPGRKYLTETLPWEEEELTVEPAPVEPFHQNVLSVLTKGAEPIVTPESAAEIVRVIETINKMAL